MSYQEAVSYLSSLNIDAIRLGLDPISGLLGRLGNPERSYPSIIVGGTNGKESVDAMISSVLKEAGYRCGLYSSPHLVDIRERIRVDGAMIAKKNLAALISEIREKATEPVSYFEFLTAAAFLHFSRCKVDLAVLEVGLGGRLDATNVVTPLVSIISNISRDHKEYLGDSLGMIAAEKAAIIKKGGICLSAARQPSVVRVLEDACRKKGARLKLLGRDFRARSHGGGWFSYYGKDQRLGPLFCPLPGRHQLDNAALAVAATEALNTKGFAIDQAVLARGLAATRWEGRLEVIGAHPTVVLDGAHNPAGASALRRALENWHRPYRKMILVFGVMGDKEYRPMLRSLAGLADKIVITKPATPRALPVEELLPFARQLSAGAEAREDPVQALAYARELAREDDLICVAGSLYLVGQIKGAFPNSLDCDKQRKT
ncbi:MAG: bifunctional folylpolyglutamate synthase/dihydrofolate synthase [Smithellaceae bacterium]|nr:bifunctional folylpolyglutamate synthase/dihydrofolate synthase [Smithellaceae bacterium]